AAATRRNQGPPLSRAARHSLPRTPAPPALPRPSVVVVEDRPPPRRAEVAEVSPPPCPPEPRQETGLPPLPTADVPARPLPSGFRARPGTKVHVSGWPLEITCDQDGAALVLVPGGPVTLRRDHRPANHP